MELASGDTAVVDLYGNNLAGVAVSDEVKSQLIANSGVIDAEGGTIAITAADGRQLVDSLVKIEGELKAPTVEQREGKIIIRGGTELAGVTDTSKATVEVNALINAAGAQQGETGGAIHITGKRIALHNDGAIDASGKAGGGEVLIGGDYKGGTYRGELDTPDLAANKKAWGNTAGGYSAVNEDAEQSAELAKIYKDDGGKVKTASRVYVAEGAKIKASSDEGKGGRAIVWSDDGTLFQGHADVSSKGEGAAAGFIEVSGKEWLGFEGTVNTSSLSGQTGSLLLDPTNLTISNSANSGVTAASPFDSSGLGTSNLSVATLQGALGSGSVIITSAAGTGGQGDVTFTDDVTWNNTNNLTVNATRHITVNGKITNGGQGDVNLNAIINPAADITINNDITTAGNIAAIATRDVTLAAGKTLTSGVSRGVSLQAANGVVTGTGRLNLNGNISIGNSALVLRTGSNGTRPSLVLNGTQITPNNGAFGTTTIAGFEDITVDQNFNTTSSLNLTAMRDITISAGRTVTANSLVLQAANNVVTGTGRLNLDGNIVSGAGAVTLSTGINGTRPSLVFDGTKISASGGQFGTLTVAGFEDITFATDTIASSINMNAMRDLHVNPGIALTATNSSGGMALRAANGVQTGTGLLHMNGILSSKNGPLTLISGVSSVDGTSRSSISLDSSNMLYGWPTFGAINIAGFENIGFDQDLISSGAITMTAANNITFGAGKMIRSGPGSAVSITAGNSAWSPLGTGVLNLNGSKVEFGTGLTLRTGKSSIDDSRPDLTLNSSTLLPLAGVAGAVTIQGFRDIVLDMDLTSTAPTTVATFYAFRDVTIAAGRTLSTVAGTTLRAADGAFNGIGQLHIDGNLSTEGALTLISGLSHVDGTRISKTFNNTNLLTPTGSFSGNVSFSGFDVLTLDRPLTTATSLSLLGGNVVVANENISTGTGWTVSAPIRIGEGKSLIFSNTSGPMNFTGSTSGLDGTAGGAAEHLTLNTGSGTLVTRLIGAIVPIGNLTIIGDNVQIAANIVGAGTLTIRPSTSGVGMVIGSADADNATTGGVNLSATEMTRLGTGWSNIELGSLSAGLVTNRQASWSNTLTLYSGNDIVNAVAITSNRAIFLRAMRDVILDASVSTSSTSTDALRIRAGRNFKNNAGANALVANGVGGRWMVYSTNRDDTTGEELLGADFNRYGCDFSGTCIVAGTTVPGTGNGLVYTFAPTLTLSGLTANGKEYDTTTAATYSGTATLNGAYAGDVVGFNSAGVTANFADANAGVNKNVNLTGYALTGTSLGYILQQPTLTATITAKALTVTGLSALDKVYDATTAASLTGTAALQGVLASDTVNLGGTATALFGTKDAGSNKGVTVSGLTLSGAQAANYTLTQPTGLTANISKADLAVTGVSAANKTYDATTAATLTGTAAVTALGSDVVGLTGTGVGSFGTKDAGNNKAVTVTGYSLSGTDALNYNIIQPTGLTATISKADLAVTGLSAQNKTYDTTTNATISGTATVAGFGSDVVSVTGAANGAFGTKDAGTGKAVTVSGLSLTGADALNYNIIVPTNLTADIAKADLAVNGLSAQNKTYDATTNAIISGTGSVTALGSDVVNVTGTATGAFATKDAGTGKAIVISGLTLGGADAHNYNIVAPSSLTADVAKADLAVTGVSAANKTYDATTAATLTGTASVTGIGADVVSVSGTGTGTFGTKDAGNNKAVTVTGYTLSGTDALNYNIIQPTGLTANINKADLAVTGLSAQNKTYDATTAATLAGAAAITALGADVVNLDGTATGAFGTKDAGNNKAVTVSGLSLSGTDANNYNIIVPTNLTADIAKADLTVTGLSAQNKTYDATTAATISGTASVTALGSDVIALGGAAVGAFATKDAGTGKAVTLSGLTLTGTDAHNYNLVAPTSLTADVAKADLAVTGLSAQNKIYDTNTNATITGTASVTALGSDVVNVTGTAAGAFNNKNAGTNKAVTVSGLGLGGADAHNYNIVLPTNLSAEITKASVDVYASDLSIVQGNTPTYNIAMTGFVGGENATTAGVTGAASVNNPANPTALGTGTYGIGLDVSGLSAQNYQFHERMPRGTLTVTDGTPVTPPPANPNPVPGNLPLGGLTVPPTVIKESQNPVNMASNTSPVPATNGGAPAVETSSTGSSTSPDSDSDTSDDSNEKESVRESENNSKAHSAQSSGLLTIHPALVKTFGLPSDRIF